MGKKVVEQRKEKEEIMLDKQIKNLAIIQARIGSSRLHNKVLMNLADKTVLEHVYDRVSKSRLIDLVVIATTTQKADDAIYDFALERGIRVFRGSENDVLDRYYQCAKEYAPKNVIRITADCPLMDSEIIDRVINYHYENDNDYTSNTIVPTFPDGEDVEIMRFEVLEEAWQNATLASQREHVTQYIIHNDKYKRGNVASEKDLGELRWTLDTQEDYEFIKAVYEELYKNNKNFDMEEILTLLRGNSDLNEINSCYERNEGLKKSLENDYYVK